MAEYLELLRTGVTEWGLWFLAVFVVLENVPIVGFFTPGVTLLVLSGFFYDTLASHWFAVFLTAYSAIAVADMAWFSLGYWGGRQTRWLQALARRSPNVEHVLTTQPLWQLVFYQFIPYFRMFFPFALGVYHYSWWRWAGLVLVGTFCYVSVFFGIGFATRQLYQSLTGAEQVTQLVNTVLVSVAVVYVLVLYRRWQQAKQLDVRGTDDGA